MNAPTPDDILSFWFEELTPKQWFNGSDGLDQTIRDRFGTWVEGLEASAYPHSWENAPDSALALVLSLDQFPRNIHGNSAAAYLLDPLALDVAQRAVGQGFDSELAAERRKFLYMPYMHSEDARIQSLSVELFSRLGDDNSLRHARQHKEVIDRFGRYPHRNVALGRKSTSEEQRFLDEGGYNPA